MKSLTEETKLAFEIMQKNVGSSPLAVKVCGGEGKMVESVFQRELKEMNGEVSKALKSNLTENWFMLGNHKRPEEKVVEAKTSDWKDGGWEYKANGNPVPKTLSRTNMKTGEKEIAPFEFEMNVPYYETWKKQKNQYKWEKFVDKNAPMKEAKGDHIRDIEAGRGGAHGIDSWKKRDKERDLKKDLKDYLKDKRNHSNLSTHYISMALGASADEVHKALVALHKNGEIDDEGNVLKNDSEEKESKKEKVESLINLMLDRSLKLAEGKNIQARKVAYFISERFIPTLETLIEAEEKDEEPKEELSIEDYQEVLSKVQKGLETLLDKVTDEAIQKDLQKYLDTIEDMLDPDEDEEDEKEEPKEIEEDLSQDKQDFFKELDKIAYMSSRGTKENTLVSYATSKSEIKEIIDIAKKYRIGSIKTDFDKLAGKFYVVLQVPSAWNEE